MKKNEKVFWIVTIFRVPKRLEIENKDNGIVYWYNVDSVN